MLEAYEKECRHYKIKHLTAYVREDHQDSLAIIERGGFKQAGKYFLMEKEIKN